MVNKIFVAGPVNSSSKLSKAFPEIGHREPEFEEIYSKVKDKLYKLFKANKEMHDIAIIGGSGTAAMEATLSSVAENPLIITNGAFGERISEICKIYNIPQFLNKYKWGEYPDMGKLEKTLKMHPKIKEVAMVYMETSTGMLNPLREVGELCKKYKKTYIVDAVSAIGAEELDITKDGIDYCVINTNKGIGGPPVMGAVCCNKSIDNFKKRNMYLDLSKYIEFGKDNQTPFTPSIPNFYIMNENLDELFKEGMDNRIKRYKDNTTLLRKELSNMGLKNTLDSHMSNVMTNYHIPDGANYNHIHDNLKKEGYLIYPGKGELLGKSMHIATMGTITSDDVHKFTKTLGDILNE